MNYNNVPLGFKNYGWNCYINSVLQVLSCTTFMKEFMEEYTDEDNKIKKTIIKYNLKFTNNIEDLKKNVNKLLSNKEIVSTMTETELSHIKYLEKHYKYFYAYIAFKSLIYSNLTQTNKTLNPLEFIEVSRLSTENNHYTHLFSGEQNDPSEFINYLFEMIHDCKSRQIKINYNPLEETCEEHKIINLYRNDFKNRYEKEYSLYIKTLIFYTIKTIKCNNCKNINYNVSPEHLLPLPIPNTQSVSIFDCFAEYTKIQKIEGDYKCDKCKEVNTSYIENNILSKSKTLILQLLRFDMSTYPNIRKNNNIVDYPLNLNIGDYVLSNQNYNYNLYGVVLHYGNLYGGHYNCFIKKNTETGQKWFLCDDETISLVDINVVLNHRNAYMLLYQVE
jgi:ubiquitin C-terminal hydrolase